MVYAMAYRRSIGMYEIPGRFVSGLVSGVGTEIPVDGSVRGHTDR